jgi:hypothetical protein
MSLCSGKDLLSQEKQLLIDKMGTKSCRTMAWKHTILEVRNCRYMGRVFSKPQALRAAPLWSVYEA